MLRVIVVIGFLFLMTPHAGDCSVPIQPRNPSVIDYLAPRADGCVVWNGCWVGIVGDDTISVWVTADGSAVDSLKIVLNNPNCIPASGHNLSFHWPTPKSIQGDEPPNCVFTDSDVCSPPMGIGMDLTITFLTPTSGLVDLYFQAPSPTCPPPCQEFAELPVPVETLTWGRIRAMYR